jgi:hypothetical protein
MERRRTLLAKQIAAFSILAFLLWLKYRAPISVAALAGVVIFLLALLTVNYCGTRFLLAYSPSPKDQHFRLVARSTSVVFLWIGMIGIFFCDVESITAIATLIRGAPISNETVGYAYVSLMIGTILAGVGAYELRIAGDRVDYFSFFTGRRSLQRREIDHAKDIRAYSAFRPMNRFELLPHKGEHLQPIIINLKAFKKPDLDVLFEWLDEKLSRT